MESNRVNLLVLPRRIVGSRPPRRAPQGLGLDATIRPATLAEGLSAKALLAGTLTAGGGGLAPFPMARRPGGWATAGGPAYQCCVPHERHSLVEPPICGLRGISHRLGNAQFRCQIHGVAQPLRIIGMVHLLSLQLAQALHHMSSRALVTPIQQVRRQMQRAEHL